MTPEIATQLADQCAEFIPTVRYEFAMHGEPTLNPNYLEIFKIFRDRLPKAQMQLTTNGVRMRRGAMQEVVRSILDSGIDFIILDTYEPERTELIADALKLEDVKVIDYYAQPKGSDVSPWHNHHRSLNNTVIIMDDISLHNGEKKNRVIYNHAGNALGVPIPDKPLEKRCTLPFREITVTWDGSVNICCMDFASELKLGNITERSLKEIWFGPEFMAVRAFLYNKNRGFTPCSRCNYGGGARVGLLAPHEEPSEEQKKLVRELVMSNTTKLNKFDREAHF